MIIIQQALFIILLVFTAFLIRKRAKFIRTNILLGKKQSISEHTGKRFRNMLLVAFGQKKMFKQFIPAFLHLLIYTGFIIINIEVLEFIVDGITGGHRSFAPYLAGFYPIAMNIFEFLAVAVLVACVIFLFRRNILKLNRFWMAEMTRWPRLDGNIILVTEVLLMMAILTMNGADQVLQKQLPDQYPATGQLLFSSVLIPGFQSMDTATLVIVERFAWWFHIAGIFAFAVYVTYSKHLHIFLAFPTTYFADVKPQGHITNMPIVTNEVKSIMGLSTAEISEPVESGRFGAKDINDLSRVNLLAAYACTECGRCTAQCPANLTGKKLSPRKIMMDTRDRMEDVGNSLASGGPGLNDGKSLLGDYISKEEINACTTCNACVEACPVMINPLAIILELRRYVSMEESGSPASWNSMFQNIETNFAPWKFSPGDRFNWAREVKE